MRGFGADGCYAVCTKPPYVIMLVRSRFSTTSPYGAWAVCPVLVLPVSLNPSHVAYAVLRNPIRAQYRTRAGEGGCINYT